MIPLRKYSYPYLGPLEFSSGAFILLVDVTRLWVKVIWGKFNWLGMIWRGTRILIKGPTADNAYQSRNQALGSKEQPVELRNRFASSHTSGEEFRKKMYFIEGSQKHVVYVTLNGRSLKQPGFFLELVSWPNWATDGEGLWLESWWRTRRSLQLSSWSYIQIGETYWRTNTTATLHRSGLCGSVARLNPLLSEGNRKHSWNIQKKHLKDPQTLRDKILWSDGPQC